MFYSILNTNTIYLHLNLIGCVLILFLFTTGNHVQAQTIVNKNKIKTVYLKPSIESLKIGVLAIGDTVRILKRRNGWIYLAYHKNQQGWVPVKQRKMHQRHLSQDNNARSFTNGGVSFQLGSVGGDFSYVGKFYFNNMPSMDIEATVQYAAGTIAALYLLHTNMKYIKPINRRTNGWATLGLGVINTVPIKSVGGKSISNLAINYGIGGERHLRDNNWLRFDIRRYTVLASKGLFNFTEFAIGISIGVDWSKI